MSKAQQAGKARHMAELLQCLQRLAGALPSNSRQSTLALLEKVLEAMKRRLDAYASDMFRLWPEVSVLHLQCIQFIISTTETRFICAVYQKRYNHLFFGYDCTIPSPH